MELYDPPSDDVDEGHREPVSRNRRAKGEQRLCFRDSEHLLPRAHRRGGWQPMHRGEHVLLEQVLRVERDVQEEPTRRRPQQVPPVPAHELPRKQLVLLPVCNYGVPLWLELNVKHPAHVGRRLLRVALHEGRVPRRLGHLHPVVEGEDSGNRPDSKHEAPNEVGRWRGREHRVHVICRGRVEVVVDGRYNNGHGSPAKDAHTLHGKHGGNEAPTRLGVGVLAHNRRGERIISADTHAQPKPDEINGSTS